MNAMATVVRRMMVHALVLGGIVSSEAAVADTFDANAILAQAKAKYSALHAYTDSGTVTSVTRSPGAPPDIEKMTFATTYVAPRQFLFEAKKVSNGERIAVWANSGDFNSWWSETKVHTDYPKGQGEMAFANASYPTNGAVTLVASLLFASAGLQSSLAAFSDPKASGLENVDGHPCYKIAGRVDSAYGSGNVAGGHKATLWIDKTTLLFRKLFEDTPDDAGTGFVSTIATTFDPQAGQKINPARFNFSIPSK